MSDLATRPLGRPRTGTSRLPYLPGLDGLRAVAVVAVMVYHANSSWLPGGFLGVEVFFVISGYLITLLLIGEHERTGRVRLGQFWLRRARRLLPALFTMMFLLTVATIVLRPDALGQLRGDSVAGFFYVSNWHQIWIGQGYTSAADFAPLRHLWSLAVEEQFYLLWPLVMAAMMRRGRDRLPDRARWVFAAAVAITGVVALLAPTGRVDATCTVAPDAYWTIADRCVSKLDAVYLSTFTRAGGVLLGAAFAMIWRPVAIMRSPMVRRGHLVDVAAVVGLVGLAALMWQVHVVTPQGGADPWLFRGGLLLTGLATLSVIAAVSHRRAHTGRILGVALLLWIGTRSYGMYLYHWPIYQLVRGSAGTPLTIIEFAAAMLLTAAITEVSYRLIEIPVRRGSLGVWLRRVRRLPNPGPRRVIATAGAACVAVMLFAGASLATAELEPNEVEQTFAVGGEVVDDVLDQAAPAATAATSSSSAAPTTVVPDTVAVPTGVPPDDVVPATDQGEGSPGPVATDPLEGVPVSPVSDPGRTPLSTLPAGDRPVETRPPVGVAGTPEEPPRSSEPITPPSAAAPTSAPTTSAAPTTTVNPNRIARLAIGDSVMLGAAPDLVARGFTVDAQVSRQMVNTVEQVRLLRAGGVLGDAVVIHLGTNGPIGDDTLTSFFDALVDVPRVVVLTIRAPRGWTDGNNAKLASLPSRYGNVVLVDWAATSGACPGDCFAGDDIHLNAAGSAYYAAQIAGALA